MATTRNPGPVGIDPVLPAKDGRVGRETMFHKQSLPSGRSTRRIYLSAAESECNSTGTSGPLADCITRESVPTIARRIGRGTGRRNAAGMAGAHHRAKCMWPDAGVRELLAKRLTHSLCTGDDLQLRCGNAARVNYGLDHQGRMTAIVIAVTLAFKRLICRVLIGVFVSAQFAIIAYACPGLSESITAGAAEPGSVSSATAEGQAAAMDAHESMAGLKMGGNDGHAAIDPDLPHLYMGHCQFGKQSADHTPAPVVSPALLTAMYTLPPAEEAAASRVPRASSLRGGPPGAGDPPHSILHCCFRD